MQTNKESERTLVGESGSSLGSSLEVISLLPESNPKRDTAKINNPSGAPNDDDEEELDNNDKLKSAVNFHDLFTHDCDDNPIYFHSFIGKIVLVTNIATQCGSAYQLRQFEELYQKYKHKDFVILAFPSNQFHQEKKGTNKEVADNCRRRFDVTFPIMEKVKVNGKDQSEIFKFLKMNKHGFLNTKRVKWNFEKFLVGRDGEILKRYSTLQNVKRKIEKDLVEIIENEDKNNLEKLKVSKSQIQRVVYI